LFYGSFDFLDRHGFKVKAPGVKHDHQLSPTIMVLHSAMVESKNFDKRQEMKGSARLTQLQLHIFFYLFMMGESSSIYYNKPIECILDYSGGWKQSKGLRVQKPWLRGEAMVPRRSMRSRQGKRRRMASALVMFSPLGVS
jgi:hypothetical protein